MLSFNLGNSNPLGGGATTLGASPATSALSSLATGAAGTAPTLGGGAVQQTQPQQQQQQSQQSTLTFRVLEDYINKWMGELDLQEKDFLNQATQLNALDKLMIENGEKIVELNNEVDRLSGDQDLVEQELDFINSQQNDLEASIKKLEDNIDQMPPLQSQQTDKSRIEMYKLLFEVDSQLRGMSGDLKEVIKRLNDTNVDMNDPTAQISKILNAHADSLNWIEQNTNAIQKEVEKYSRAVDERLKESGAANFPYLMYSANE